MSNIFQWPTHQSPNQSHISVKRDMLAGFTMLLIQAEVNNPQDLVQLMWCYNTLLSAYIKASLLSHLLCDSFLQGPVNDAKRIRLRPWTSGNRRDNIIWWKHQGEYANCIPNKRLTSTVYMELLQLLLCPWNSPGNNTRMGSYPKGIFLIQGSHSGLLHYTQFLYILSHQKKPYIPPDR